MRAFLPKPVPLDIVEHILEMASRALVDTQKKLSHPEFGFARYLLEMAIQEFISPGSDSAPLSGSVPGDDHKYDMC